ncbi:divergent polysaccharide deacetylase family protein, partial [Acidiphilium sp.]|uniref:divergent polysaccharide deacetylase family protein n=1 Tax=Acidiphilium sp. TaxID=527 RepID=UPI003D050205
IKAGRIRTVRARPTRRTELGIMPRIPPALKLFWGGVAAVLVIGGAVLQFLGPIPPKLPPRAADGAIPAPSPLLEMASGVDPHWLIPHPGAYGVLPMQYYAARTVARPDVPRIAIMVAGLGYALGPGLDAVRDLPPAVSLAVSPYGVHDAAIAAAARKAGHETLMGLPMQVDGGPDITAGDRALRAGGSGAHNLERLDWALSRLSGYAGVTDAIGLTVPELFMTHKRAAAWLAGQLTADGLFMVIAEPTIASPDGVDSRSADVVIDPSQGRAAEAASLSQLANTALTRGSALGVLLNPTPPAIAALATWCQSLTGQHIALVPVSALVAPALVTPALAQ